jgi:uncharacterized protein YkwD
VLAGGIAVRGNPVADKVRAEMFELTNKFRETQKRKPLKLNSKLAAAAQKHAENMARLDRFGDDKEGHILEGVDGKLRIQREGYRFASWAENAGMLLGDAGAKTTLFVIENWKKSPGDRENLVYVGFTETGIGAARAKSGKWYFCQVFGRPR